MRWFRWFAMLSLCLSLMSCQTIQEKTNEEAPYQTKQKEGRKEFLKSGEEKEKEQSK